MRKFSGLLAALSLAAALIGAPASLQAAESPTAQLTEKEARDAAIVDSAWRDWQNAPETGLQSHLRDLHEVLNGAPAEYPLIEKRNGVVISRASPGNDGDALTAAIMALDLDEQKGDSAIVLQPNIYGRASLLLGWWYNHTRQYAEASKALDHGLTLQPDNPYLVSEKGMVLVVRRQFPEALALYDDWFSRQMEDPPGTPNRARLLRARGFVLIELKRLDEAEAAYTEALEIEPDHKGARQELAYIQELRGGTASPKGIGVFTSEKAKKGQD